MEYKSKIGILSVLISLIAMLLLISSIAIIEISYRQKASVENIIDPLNSLDDGSFGFAESNIQVFDGSNSDSDDDDDDDDDDNEAPGTITDLTVVDIGTDYIYWNWTNPTDSDFYMNRIYLDGVYQTSTTNNYYNATGLSPSTTYTITIHTIDDNANVNDTDVNDTQTTLSLGPQAPVITPTIPDVSFVQGGSNNTILLDNHVIDIDTPLADLTWSFSGNTNVIVSIDALDSNRITFSAVSGWSGTETITFRVDDLDGNFDTQPMDVTVTIGPNAPPVLSSTLPDQTLDEDTNINNAFNLESYFDDAEDGSAGLTYTVVLQTNTGVVTATIDVTNNVDINTLADMFGTSDVTIRATDTGGLFVEDTFTITVNWLQDDYHKVCGAGVCEEWYD
mgnify:CR=1 FL=1